MQQKARLANISDKLVLSAINNGVIPQVKADLRRNPPNTLEDLLKTAELSGSANSVMPAQVNCSEQTLRELLDKAMGVYLAEVKGQVNQIAENQASVNAAQHIQHSTDKPNTYRQRTRSNFKDNIPRKPNNPTKVKGICFRCGQKNPDHTSNDCYARNNVTTVARKVILHQFVKVNQNATAVSACQWF